MRTKQASALQLLYFRHHKVRQRLEFTLGIIPT